MEKTKPCRKCSHRYKLLTDDDVCANCDYPKWRKKYFII